MENKPSLREVALDDHTWWTTVDEAYWQTLVAHGEVAPETVPPAPPQETFYYLELEVETLSPNPESTAGQASEPSSQSGWHEARIALEKGTVFCLRVTGANRGGLLAQWNGLQGFVPASHLLEMPRYRDPQDRRSKLADRIGDTLRVCVIEVSEEQQRLVLSERAARSDSDAPASILKDLHPGDTRLGIVTNLTTFGAFVDLGGIEGLIHISEISWDRIRHPSDVLDPGQQVEVYVVGVNPEACRIALSLKRLSPDPWSDLESRFRVGEIIEGTVTNVVSFGAFVRVEEGLEGLIHISELAEGSFLHPRSVIREGDAVRVRVLNINKEEHRLGLSLRQAQLPGHDTPGRRVEYEPSS